MEINQDTPVEKIVEAYPKSIEIFRKYGINVIICGEVVWDSIGEVCRKNGVEPELVIREITDLKKT